MHTYGVILIAIGIAALLFTAVYFSDFGPNRLIVPGDQAQGVSDGLLPAA